VFCTRILYFLSVIMWTTLLPAVIIFCLTMYELKSNSAKWPWTETNSHNKPFLLQNCFCQTFVTAWGNKPCEYLAVECHKGDSKHKGWGGTCGILRYSKKGIGTRAQRSGENERFCNQRSRQESSHVGVFQAITKTLPFVQSRKRGHWMVLSIEKQGFTYVS
jgi:hypothetical protein